jgi:hypothetical protein
MNKTLILILCLCTLPTYAVVNSSTSSYHPKQGNSFTGLFDLEFVLTSEQTKDIDDHEVDGAYTSLKTSFLYHLTPKDDLRLYVSAVNENFKKTKGDDETYLELAEFMYRRNQILNQKDHWVSMDFEFKNYYVLDYERRQRWGFNGATIPQFIFKKSFTPYAGVEFKVRRHFTHRTADQAGTLNAEDRLYLTPYMMFAHKLIVSTQLKYRHKRYKDEHVNYRKSNFSRRPFPEIVMDGKDVEITTLRPSLMYFLNKSSMVEVYAQTVLNDSSDNERSTQNQMKDELLYGAALYLTAF